MITYKQYLLEKQDFDFLELVKYFIKKRKLSGLAKKLAKLYKAQIDKKFDKTPENKELIDKQLENIKNQITSVEDMMDKVIEDVEFMKDSLSSSRKLYKYKAKIEAMEFELTKLESPEEKKRIADKVKDAKKDANDALQAVKDSENEHKDKLEDAKKKAQEDNNSDDE